MFTQNVNSMNKPLLGYWNISGLCSPIRMLLNFSNVDFDEKLYQFNTSGNEREEWLREKFTLPLDFPNLPYLFDGNVKLTQSVAIIRYLARKYKLAGETEEETTRLDMIEQQLRDVRTPIATFLYKKLYKMEPEDKLRNQFYESMTETIELLSKFLGDRIYINGDKITYVDFMLFETLDFCLKFDEIALNSYQNLKSFVERIKAIPKIHEYLISGKYSNLQPFPPLRN